MAYLSGAIAPLTNDLSSYSAVDVDSSRTRLVTSRQDLRTSLWVGDADGADAVEVVPRTPFGGRNVFLAWGGERLLYDATFAGRPVIAELVPGSTTPVEAVADAFHVAAAPDGSAIVFGAATRGREGLWRVDASGRAPVQLVSGFAVEPVVTRDRAVVFVSNLNGAQSPWIVSLDGGEATEITRENVSTVDVSPDGRRLAFVSAALVVCDLPVCANRRELPVPTNFLRYVRFTPDGEEVAYIAGSAGRDLWAIPLDGRPPHALTHFAPDARRIETFGWSRDGRRLALIRSESEQDIVLLTGLRP
jgi:Tol biopolymer transport system component